MPRQVQDIAVWEYAGPQGSVELAMVEQSSIDRSKSRTKVKTMNRNRRPIAHQSGTAEVGITLTVVPELANPEVDWLKAWNDDEVFTLVGEKGLEGAREKFSDCMVESVNDSHNENGEARQEVQISALVARAEP